MGKFHLHIANANEKFTAVEIETIKSAVRSAEHFINDNFEFNYDVDVIVAAPSFMMATIPEDGIAGWTYSSQLIVITINKDERQLSRDRIFETLCHESSHSLRWEKLPEYARTLFDSIIMEGLAVVLEEIALEWQKCSEKQYFLTEVQKTDQKTAEAIFNSLKGEMNSETYDYKKVFMDSSDTLPLWSGYKLGYYLVKKHLRDTGSTIFDETLASYSKFKPRI